MIWPVSRYTIVFRRPSDIHAGSRTSHACLENRTCALRQFGESVVEGKTRDWPLGGQVLIVAPRASRQSTGCLLTPSLSAMRTTLFENGFIAVPSALKPRFSSAMSVAPYAGMPPQQPVISVTSGCNAFAWPTAHWYQAWQRSMRSCGYRVALPEPHARVAIRLHKRNNRPVITLSHCEECRHPHLCVRISEDDD